MKAFTDIEQSKKLAKILPIESADMARFGGENIDISSRDNVIMTNYISAKKEFSMCGEIPINPCWSLAALLALLPLPTLEETPITETETKWQCTIYCDKAKYWTELHIEPIDALIEAILITKENNR